MTHNSDSAGEDPTRSSNLILTSRFLHARRWLGMSVALAAVLTSSMVVFASPARAGSIGIFELSAFITAPELDPDILDSAVNSLQDTQLGSGLNEFQSAGLAVQFTNGLNVDNEGSVTWKITNNSGSALTDVRFFFFLDADIDSPINGFFNEFGSVVSIVGAGTGDQAPDSFEIDEPGFAFGDIFDNLLAGALDNTNGVPSSTPDDVALALGFEVGSLLDGGMFTADLQFGQNVVGGLIQTDPDSNFTFAFNGTLSVDNPAQVEEPMSALIFAMGLGFLGMLRKSPRILR